MIAPTSITLKRVTGYAHTLTEKTLTADTCSSVWEETNKLLRAWAWSVSSGYDEVDFTVLYADGYVYEGIFLLHHPRERRTERLEDHMKNHCLVCSGRKCPRHLTNEHYQSFLTLLKQEQREEWGKILDTYQIGDEL